MVMLETHEFSAEAVLAEAIASALRDELGVQIEEQPGFRDPSKAGQVNRAFRVVVRTILNMARLPVANLEQRLSQLLADLARRRLEAGSLDASSVELLLVMELAGRDDWLAFLILTDWPEITFLLHDPDAPRALH
jgi:hypothetical protein